MARGAAATCSDHIPPMHHRRPRCVWVSWGGPVLYGVLLNCTWCNDHHDW